jgi:hypothetical protein
VAGQRPDHQFSTQVQYVWIGVGWSQEAGELIGDTGQKLKVEAKQVQPSAMKIGEHAEEDIMNLAQEVVDVGRDDVEKLK